MQTRRPKTPRSPTATQKKFPLFLLFLSFFDLPQQGGGSRRFYEFSTPRRRPTAPTDVASDKTSRLIRFSLLSGHEASIYSRAAFVHLKKNLVFRFVWRKFPNFVTKAATRTKKKKNALRKRIRKGRSREHTENKRAVRRRKRSGSNHSAKTKILSSSCFESKLPFE